MCQFLANVAFEFDKAKGQTDLTQSNITDGKVKHALSQSEVGCNTEEDESDSKF